MIDQTATLARQIWRCLREFQCQERLQGSDNSSPEIRSIQIELSNLILTLYNLSEAIRSTPINGSTSMHLTKLAEGPQELVEELNSIDGTDGALLTNSPPSSLKAIFEAAKYTLQFLRNRIASSADALSEAIVELLRARKSEKSDTKVESEDDKRISIIAAWLAPLDFFGTQRSVYRKHQQGTGQWLLESETFQSWLLQKIKCLAIVGKPGSGKTVLTSIIVHFLRSTSNNRTAVIGIYLNRNSPNQTIENILRSILQQIIRQRAAISKNVMGFYNRHSESKYRPAIPALVEVLATEVLKLRRTCITIDALDEIEPPVRISLLQILQSLRVNLLVISCAYPAVERELREFTTMDLEASSDDVKRFIEAELSEDHRLSNDAELRSMMSEHIEKKSQGMHVSFYLATLQITNLKTKPTKRALRLVLASVPNSIAQIYKESFDTILAQPLNIASLAERVLSWVTFTYRPLTLSELQHALAVKIEAADIDLDDLPDENVLVSSCKTFITYDPDFDEVRFIHSSVKDYLQEEVYFPGPGHKDIAVTCLDYLFFDAFRGGACNTEELYNERLKRYPFFAYAAQHWGHHVRSMSEDSVIQKRVFDFLQDSFKVASAYQALAPSNTRSSVLIQWPQQLKSGIHLAAYFGLQNIIERYCDRGDDLEVTDGKGQSPLIWAIEREYPEVVRVLVKYISMRELKNPSPSSNSLLWAVEKGNSEIVSLLIPFQDQIESQTSWGQTPLAIAAAKGDVVIVKLLMEAGARINSKDYAGHTPLSSAAASGQERSLQLLLEQPAIIADSKGNQGQTPLSMAAANG
ncbi:MAG: hypothetical protein Q9195_008183 [Heterodermia aff. obscurata]